MLRTPSNTYSHDGQLGAGTASCLRVNGNVEIDASGYAIVTDIHNVAAKLSTGHLCIDVGALVTALRNPDTLDYLKQGFRDEVL